MSYFFELDKFVFGQVIEPARSADDDMRCLCRIFELCLVVLERDATEVATEAQFWLLEVATLMR